jgi:hypothetical protein
VKIWIARDGEKGDEENGYELWLYETQPRYSESKQVYMKDNSLTHLDWELFPEIKNGECYSAEIVLGEKI